MTRNIKQELAKEQTANLNSVKICFSVNHLDDAHATLQKVTEREITWLESFFHNLLRSKIIKHYYIERTPE